VKINIENGLPIISVKLKYHDKIMILDQVLIDTGSSNTIFDTDLVQEIGLSIDPTYGKARRMYGVGGESELCYEQPVSNLEIDSYLLDNFLIQLGITRETYGFDGIIGTDFIEKNHLILDFKKKIVYT
jgi:hypothetical protein